jgi:hypothetical protein
MVPDTELLDGLQVHVNMRMEAMFGRAIVRVRRRLPGEGVHGRREVMRDRRILCGSCDSDTYHVASGSAELPQLLR